MAIFNQILPLQKLNGNRKGKSDNIFVFIVQNRWLTRCDATLCLLSYSRLRPWRYWVCDVELEYSYLSSRVID